MSGPRTFVLGIALLLAAAGCVRQHAPDRLSEFKVASAHGPQLIPAPPSPNDAWMRHAVIYGVVPPLFGHPPLQQVTKRLDHLASLGVDAQARGEASPYYRWFERDAEGSAFVRAASPEELARAVLNFGEAAEVTLVPPSVPGLSRMLEGPLRDALGATVQGAFWSSDDAFRLTLPARSGQVLVPATSAAPAAPRR